MSFKKKRSAPAAGADHSWPRERREDRWDPAPAGSNRGSSRAISAVSFRRGAGIAGTEGSSDLITR